MTTFRWKHIAVLLLVVLVLIAAICWRGRQLQPKLVLPKVGDEVKIELLLEKPNVSKDYEVRWIMIRCVNIVGLRCVFDVYYLHDGGGSERAYSVMLDYGARTLSEGSMVWDTHGRLVPRGKSVRGIPVPFHNFLVREDSLPSKSTKQELEGQLTAVIWRRGHPMRSNWKLTLRLTSPHSKPPFDYFEYQYWASNDWLWTKLFRPDNVSLTAKRERSANSRGR